ncbi:MAG TPA: carboxypeptidase-like regulatory domain-containing protein [Thermoanaerobaculia bacterium]|nr:carboxypeptidase-like regulatory domain-containing protein [Thermoanaerobaculia bacterium]
MSVAPGSLPLLQETEHLRLRARIGRAGAVAFVFGSALLAGSLHAAAPPRKARLILEIAPQDSKIEPASWRGLLTLRPVDSGSSAIVRKLAGERALTFEVPERSRWDLIPSIPGFWTPELAIQMEGADVEITYRVRLWPAATIGGLLRPSEPGAKPPSDFRLEVMPPLLLRPEQIVPDGAVRCSVDNKGRFACGLPAGLPLRLALRGEDWAPIYRQGVTVPRGRSLELGALSLVRGGSLIGWVEAAGARLEPGKCRARLAPYLPSQGGVEVAEGLRATGVEADVGADGFFQFAGVAQGVYRVVVEQPGFSSASVAPLELWAGQETRLQKALLLRRPLRLVIAVEPPRDGLGRPWFVRLDRNSDAGPARDPSLHREGSTNRDGNFTVGDAAEGVYSIEVTDSLGNRFFDEPDAVVSGVEEVRLDVALDLIDLKGTVSLGDRPLAATLWFGGRYGAPRVEMSSNAKGEFAGVVPKAGSWKVEVSSPEPELQSEARVKVEPNPQGTAEVEIELPDTSIAGQVVDATGLPVAGARVSLRGADHQEQAQTGPEGRFLFRGVAEGPVRMTAAVEAPSHASSEDATLEVRAGEPAGPVVLRLREMRRLSGRVVSPIGPLAGARLVIFPQRPSPGSPQIARSRGDGSFEVDVPKSTASALVVVSPPGHALRAVDVRTGEEPILVPVTAEAGTLEISWTQPGARDDGNLLGSVTVDGLPLPTGELFQWALGHGERFETPTGFRVANLAPGFYRACIAPKSIEAAGESSDPARPNVRCAEGSLAAGADLELEIAPSSSR